jgi:hypothetical protein
MSDAGDKAEDEVRSRIRSLQRRGEIAGDNWNDLPAETRSWLKRRSSGYADDGEDPDQAARHAIRRGQREGKLPHP